MEHSFMKGMGLGILAGAAVSAVIPPKKKRSVQRAADNAVKAMETTMENIADKMNFQS